MMTTVRELRDMLLHLDNQDAQIFLTIPKHDHWDSIERVHVGEVMREQRSHYKGGEVEYAITLGKAEGEYDSQNLSDGLLWRRVEEEPEDDLDDEPEDGEWDEAAMLAYLREDEDNVLWANESAAGDILRDMAARNLVVIGKNNRVTLPTFTRPDSGDGLTYTRV